MKKIAVICSTDYKNYPVGGMMSFVVDVAPALAKHFDVDFWGVESGHKETHFVSGGEKYPIRYFGNVKTGKKIIPNLLRVVWHLFRSRKVVLAEEYDALYIHGIPLNLAFPEKMISKRINHVHGLNNPFTARGKQGISYRIAGSVYDLIRKHAVKMSDLVFLAADSKGLAPFTLENPSNGKLIKIENFCDVLEFNSWGEKADQENSLVRENQDIILYVGRFSSEKDPILAIQTIDYLLSNSDFDACLIMIGDGPLLSKAREMVNSLDLTDHVKFLGTQSRQNVACWMRRADVLILTSVFEGFPVVLAEAVHCSLPIVSGDITGVHDLVVCGRNGVIVHKRSPELFANGVINAINNQEEYGQESLELSLAYAPEKITKKLCFEILSVMK